MLPEIYWVESDTPGKLAVMPRPRSGDWLEDEIKGLRQSGIDILVSLLTAEEIEELKLTKEKTLSEKNGIEFISFPIPDRQVPESTDNTESLICTLNERMSDGSNIAVHCRMGIGRSAMIAAALLVRQGISIEEAFARISAARGFEVPDTQEQIDWVHQYDAALDTTRVLYMAKKRIIETTINGQTEEFLCEPRQTLLEVLRDVLDLTGTKEGCSKRQTAVPAPF